MPKIRETRKTLARGDELQRLAVALDAQQQQIGRDKAQLEAILASLAAAVLVGRPDGTLRLSNAAYQQLFAGGSTGLPPAGDWAVLAGEHTVSPCRRTRRRRRGRPVARHFA